MEVPAGAIQDALRRLLASSQFARSPRASRFLRYIVEATLDGRGEGLKEYVLGVEVFDRAASFDPRIDTIVRVEAVKLRKRLQEYYRGAGQNEPVIIDLPKGAYIPRFQNRFGGEGLAPSESEIRSIAVLPFANLSADLDNQYFSDGLAEEILNGLARVRGLRVAARSSAFAFRGKEQDVREIAQALHVGAVLEGSVRRSGNRIRISVQLIHAANGYHLWSDTIEGEVHDAWAVQEQIARAIIAAIQLELKPEGRRTSTDAHSPNPDAFDLYLKARYASEYMQEASQRKAVDMFQRAIVSDPYYALPLVGLARCYLNLAALNLARPCELFPHTKDALERALALDSKLPEAHGLMASTIARYEWDWRRAEEHYRRALALAPNSAEVRHGYSIACLVPQGRFEEAFAQNRRARELDPFSPTFARGYVWLLIHSRRFHEAERECCRLIAERRDPAYFRNLLGLVLFAQTRLEEACAEFKAAVAGGPNPEVSQVNVAIVQAILGQRAAAEELLEYLQQQAAIRYVPATSLAFLIGALGREEEALDALEQACLNREYSLLSAKVFFLFDPFRRYPRFQALLRELHLG